MREPQESGYAGVDGLQLYWESYGTGGTPLVLTHGGFGLISMWGPTLDRLAEHHRVVGVELQGHGHTPDLDRPFSWTRFGDDLAGLIETLGLAPADVMGYSLGGGASLRLAIQHPQLVRRLVLISTPSRRDGWFPEVLAQMSQIGRAGFEMMRQSPLYEMWAAVAPDQNSFPTLMDKTGDLLRTPYDWSDEVRGLRSPTQLVYADVDSIPTAHMAEFYALLGGGLRDAGWEVPQLGDHRLAVLPGRTHYDLGNDPRVVDIVREFLDCQARDRT